MITGQGEFGDSVTEKMGCVSNSMVNREPVAGPVSQGLRGESRSASTSAIWRSSNSISLILRRISVFR
jgi:hypothetical protein